MNLVDLITLLQNPSKANGTFTKEFPGVDVEQIDVYLRSKLAIDSEVKLFDAEKIPNEIEIEIDATAYVNLFPLYMLREMVEENFKTTGTKLSSADLAGRIIEYRMKDA